MKKNEILDQSFDFALKIIELAKFLKNKKEYVISNQILRSGTSVGANVTEAQAAQSTKDFIAKLSIASKESRETNYWLRIIQSKNLIKNKIMIESTVNESSELKLIFGKIYSGRPQK